MISRRQLPLVFVSVSSILLVYNAVGVEGKKAGPSGVKMTPKSSMKYLARFGYISNDLMEHGRMSDKEVMAGLKMYQKYAGLPPTGLLTNDTMEMMMAPRCGNMDTGIVREMKKNGRRKRFLVHSQWEKRLLIYKFINYPQCCLTPEVIERETERAFQAWQHAVGRGLLIRRGGPNDDVDIEIKFAIGPHNDNMSFGSVGNGDRMVAHAFYPKQSMDHPIRGDIHFHDREEWTSRTLEGQNYFQTALHEIGHALGLDHSMEHSATMYAMVSKYIPGFGLHADDIEGIQSLYGEEDETELDRITPHIELGNDLDTAASSIFPRLGTRVFQVFPGTGPETEGTEEYIEPRLRGDLDQAASFRRFGMPRRLSTVRPMPRPIPNLPANPPPQQHDESVDYFCRFFPRIRTSYSVYHCLVRSLRPSIKN